MAVPNHQSLTKYHRKQTQKIHLETGDNKGRLLGSDDFLVTNDVNGRLLGLGSDSDDLLGTNDGRLLGPDDLLGNWYQ